MRAWLIAAAIAVGSTVMPASAAEKIVFATYISEVYTVSKADIWFMKEVEKRTNGDIKFETYFSGSLLKAADLFPGLASGAADMVEGVPAGYNRKEYPLANIMMPYISTKADAITRAHMELVTTHPAYRKEFESRNAKVLYTLAWAENTVWSRKPLAKVEDFKGLKVRSVQAIADVVQKLGGTPVSLSWPDAIEALQRGVVDAMSSAPFDSAVFGGLHEIAKVGTDAGGMGIFSVGVTAMNLQRYNKLSEANRKVVDEVSAEVPDYALKLLDEQLKTAADKLCSYKGDVTINLFPPEEAKKVRDLAATSLHEEWIKNAKAATGVDTKAMFEQFQSLVRKHEANSTYVSGFELYQQRCKKT